MSRPVSCPRPTDALGRWLETYLYRRMLRRSAPSAVVLWCWVTLGRGHAVVLEGRQTSARVGCFEWQHVQAILSAPTNVWKVCARGVGWASVDVWRQKVTAVLVRARPVLPSWVWPLRIALACLLLFATVSAPAQAGVLSAALAGTTIFELETGGSDTANGGAFDPGQTAGMFTDGAATSATGASPVFSSASYNFVAGDVGAWVFISSGTNWTPGWYKIASVGSNVATLSAAVGAAVVSTGAAGATVAIGLQPSLVIGCATTASPTGATWSIDYSQQATAAFTYTDLVSAGAGLTVSSVAFPFAKQQVGNAIVITGGTNFTTGRYVIASVAAGVATVLGAANITTGIGASGTGGQGGAVLTQGQVGAHLLANMQMFQKTGSYTQTTATGNVAGGYISLNIAGVNLEGYDTVRGDLTPIDAAGTRPTITASGISTFSMMNCANVGSVRNFIYDGASLTASRGVEMSVAGSLVYNVLAKNCTNGGHNNGSALGVFARCAATGCATVAAFNASGVLVACVAYSNTFTGFATGNIGHYVTCLSYANSGASSDGFSPTNARALLSNCTAYGNGRDGFRLGAAGILAINCASESNTGVGFTVTSISVTLLNCAVYLNTGGNTVVTSATKFKNLGLITGTASFFTNAAGGDFSLNTTAGGGALLRAAGYPGVFPVGLTTGYVDIGAAQHADPSGGGGAPFFIVND